MRKILFSILFSMIGLMYANGQTPAPRVCVKKLNSLGNEVTYCNPTDLGYVDPCSGIDFYVDTQSPGWDYATKIDWYVNGVHVATPHVNDNILGWVVKTPNLSVYCVVTYLRYSDNTSSGPITATAFTPLIKALNFTEITTSTPTPNYGCSNTVSYSLNTFSCGNFCDYTYTVGTNYTITWQPPAGWVQTSISANGNDVSFTPDATTGGNLTATISLPCGFQATKTFTISRTAPTPTFTSTSPITACSSPVSLSINPACGADSYTYTIIGNSGVTFAANGLQTLTTSSTTVSLLSGSSASITVKAKANYPGNISSSEVSQQVSIGAPSAVLIQSMSNLNVCDDNNTSFQLLSSSSGNYAYEGTLTTISDYSLATSYSWNQVSPLDANFSWSVNGRTVTVYSKTGGNQALTLRCTARNSCGSTFKDFYFSPTCFLLIERAAKTSNEITNIAPSDVLQPNPTNGIIYLHVDTGIREVLVRNIGGTELQRIKFRGGNQNETINIQNLPSGVYIVQIFDGGKWINRKVSKQ